MVENSFERILLVPTVSRAKELEKRVKKLESLVKAIEDCLPEESLLLLFDNFYAHRSRLSPSLRIRRLRREHRFRRLNKGAKAELLRREQFCVCSHRRKDHFRKDLSGGCKEDECTCSGFREQKR